MPSLFVKRKLADFDGNYRKTLVYFPSTESFELGTWIEFSVERYFSAIAIGPAMTHGGLVDFLRGIMDSGSTVLKSLTEFEFRTP